MITISLNQIRAQSPCESGWKKVLVSKGGTSADMDAQFPLADILESNGLDDTLWCLRCLPEHDNLWRKFAVWRARQVELLMTDERSRNAMDVAWRHADGLATDEELAAARAAAWAAVADAVADAVMGAARAAAVAAARAADRIAASDDAGVAAVAAVSNAAGADAGAAARDAVRALQKAKLIEILTAGEWVDSATAWGTDK